MRQSKSFTISDDVLAEVAATKGEGSTSERVNELLRRALEAERHERLEREAAEFFAKASERSSRESGAYREASMRVLSRD
jgi:hypothetical protein